MGAYFSRSRRMGTKTWLMVTILGFASISNASLPTPELSGSIRSISRNPRLFYVSSTTSTSFATTRCYLAVATGSCKRKRRDLVSDEPDSQYSHTNVDAIPSYESEKRTDGQFEEYGQEAPTRDAKMLLYWVTTTSTTTSYTATSTLATLDCVPNDFSLSR